MTVPYKFIALTANILILNYCSPLDVQANNFKDGNNEAVVRNGECGGTIEMDRGTLIYLGDGSIQPGEICVWTIHLRTMEGFRINFTNLDIPGGDSSCYLSSVGIYGLSNLVPRDDLENYRLCNENNNVGNYYLTSHIASVTFHSSSSFPPNNSIYGFSLHWEGSRFQPVPTEHSASYSVAPTGVIWHPFEGEYTLNAGMTWLVKGVRSVDIGPTVVDIDIIFVDLENCNLSNKCLCDALIIYDVSRNGELHEIDRFCGDKSSGQFQNVNSNFIVAFYTDIVNVPQSGYGFQAVWRQGTEYTTTEDWELTTTEDNWTTTFSPSTTEESTSTSEPPMTTTDNWETTSQSPEISSCGGIIQGTSGIISYKHRQPYQNNELCIWTIRPDPPYTQIYVELLESGFELNADYISVFGFKQFNGLSGEADLGKTSNGYQAVTLNGSVAVLQFSSDSSTTGTGFLLQFTTAGIPSPTVAHFYDFHTNLSSGSVRYPPSGNYRNGELSTFVIADGNTNNDPNEIILRYTPRGIDYCFSSCQCDGVLIYQLWGYVRLLKRDDLSTKEGFLLEWA